MNEVNRSSITQIDLLKKQLQTNKSFLNMVIHDMRSPTSSINQGLQMTSQNLSQNMLISKEYKEFQNKFKQGFEKLEENLNQFEIN